ncbi:MAG: hypothetical protein JOZ47_14055 [Kutzneria sp.]|nr:hypothetical protein [Kutzneria sp.]
MIGRYCAAVTMIAAVGAAPAACDQHTAPTKPVTAVQSSGGDVPYSAECDGASAINVHPATPTAQTAADRACSQADEEIRNAPWPSGVHPLG